MHHPSLAAIAVGLPALKMSTIMGDVGPRTSFLRRACSLRRHWARAQCPHSPWARGGGWAGRGLSATMFS
eukprot:1772952-Pyramimonas_sp.AAC.1